MCSSASFRHYIPSSPSPDTTVEMERAALIFSLIYNWNKMPKTQTVTHRQTHGKKGRSSAVPLPELEISHCSMVTQQGW